MAIQDFVEAANRRREKHFANYAVTDEEREKYARGSERVSAIFSSLAGRKPLPEQSLPDRDHSIYGAVDVGRRLLWGEMRQVVALPSSQTHKLSDRRTVTAYTYRLDLEILGDDVDIRTLPTPLYPSLSGHLGHIEVTIGGGGAVKQESLTQLREFSGLLEEVALAAGIEVPQPVSAE